MFVNDLEVDNLGNVFVGGEFAGGSITAPPLDVIGQSDAFVMKLDSGMATTWARSYGGTFPGGVVSVMSTTRDPSGNAYAAGLAFGVKAVVAGLVTQPLITSTGFEAFLVKFDVTGQPVWARTFGSATGLSGASGVAADGAGNIYVTGSFLLGDMASPMLSATGFQDAFLLKLDPSGAVLWARGYGGMNAVAVGRAVAVDPDGNALLVGDFGLGNMTAPMLTLAGDTDGFVIKVSDAGTTLWGKGFGGPGATMSPLGIAADATGNPLFVGSYDTAALAVPPLAQIGDTDGFAIKLDFLDGDVLWARNYGGSGTSTYISGVATGAGNVYVSGDYFNGDLTTPALTQIGFENAMTLRLDPMTGGTVWARSFGGAVGSVQSGGIAADNAGRSYLVGFMAGDLTTPPLTPIGIIDAVMIELDASGTLKFAKNFGGPGSSVNGRSINVDNGGNYHIGGYFADVSMTVPPLPFVGEPGPNLNSFVLRQVAGTVPDAPTIGTATRGSGQISVAFTPPANDGGNTITTYTATCGFQSASGPGSPIVVMGLSNGTPYTCTVTATNGVGTSPPSAQSNTVTPASAPDAPTIGVAVRGNSQIAVAAPPAPNNAGFPVLFYTAKCGGQSTDGINIPIVVSGLVNGVPYTCTVTATNSIGTSAPSAPSNSVTPANFPSAPVIGAVTAGNTQITVNFSPPSATAAWSLATRRPAAARAQAVQRRRSPSPGWSTGLRTRAP